MFLVFLTGTSIISVVSETFVETIRKWKGDLSLKEAAALLGVDYPSFRKYACGKRTPGKLARQMLEIKMKQNQIS